jgi:hypothetical protein
MTGTFQPRLDILPAAQRALWPRLVPQALAAGQQVQGPSFNPHITLKALAYFGDAELAALPKAVQRRLRAAVAAVQP